MNLPLIALSRSRDRTAGYDTSEFWVALTSGSVKPLCILFIGSAGTYVDYN